MRLRRLGAAFVLALMVMLGATPLASADTSDFTIDNFAADYTLGEDDPQGTLTVHEQLTVNFSDYNHGIYRAIPDRYNSMPQHVHIIAVTRDGANEHYSKSTSNQNVVLKIGSPTTTITGLHHYEVDYKVYNVIRFVGDRQELNWNVNGTQSQQPFLHVTTQLHVPAELTGKLTDAKCYTGIIGSTGSDCLVTTNRGVITFTTTRQLNGGETLTFNAQVPHGYFARPTLVDRWDDYKGMILPAVGLPLLALLLGAQAWLRSGRDSKGRGTIVPEYAPPADLKPAEVDVLLNNTLGKNAVAATIIDLAIRKYLKIHETESKGVLGFGRSKAYSFEQVTQSNTAELNNYEGLVLAGLFASGTVVTIDSLSGSFYKTVQSLQKSIPKSLANRGYFRTNPATAGSLWHWSGIALGIGALFLIRYGVGLTIGLVAAGLILLFFGFLMPSRTRQGAEAKDAVEGLKLYLNTAEKDRIAMLQGPGAPYAAQSAEPTKTVELFEKLLPYAMVLGVEKQWAKQFEGIYSSPPDWYSGNWTTFTTLNFANSLSGSVGAMSGSFAAPSSGSSGFSGGAGGGGGGGGVGGW